MTTTQYPASLDEAMAIFQANLPNITKDEKATVRSDKGSYSYGYAGLDTVSEKVLRALGALGVSWRTKPTLDETGKFVLQYRLRHVSGEEESGVWPLQLATPQQMGSAITYARRYSLMAVTGVFPEKEDDDGAAASQAPRARAASASGAPEGEAWEDSQPARPARTAPAVSVDAGMKAIQGAATVDLLNELRSRVDGYATREEISVDDAATLYAAANAREAELTGNQGGAVPSQQPAGPPIQDVQRRKLFALFNETGRKDRAAQMEFLRRIANRPLESRNDLTADEARAAIGALETQVGQGTGTNGSHLAVVS